MITFTSDVICGNGKFISYEQKNETEQITFVAESKMNEPAPLWFHFRVEGLSGGTVRFVIGNAHQFLRDAADANVITNDYPVFRQPSGEWKRTYHCEYEIGYGNVPISSFTIPKCPETVEVAFCFPYSLADLNITLSETNVFSKSIIGYSTRGREILRYSLNNQTDRKLPGVYITCRQHAGEVGGSWVLDGLLRYFNNTNRLSEMKDISLWIIPFVDVDGVDEGCYGKDQFLGDMNRSWKMPFTPRTEISAIIQDVVLWQKQCIPELHIDIHSPAHEVRGMLFNLSENLKGWQRKYQINLLEKANEILMKKNMEPFMENIVTKDNAGSSQGKDNTCSIFFQKKINIPSVLIESSYQGPKSKGVYGIHDYWAYGESLARAILGLIKTV